MENKIKVRFAPSPTGPFHIGGARSALFNWLVAKHTGGTFLVRIEDTDLARSSRESEENIKEAMKWLGLNWDEGIDVGGDNGPYRQTERLDIYKKEVQRLIDEGKAYYCYCTEEELQKEREEQLAEGKTPVYGGHCRHLTPEQVEEYKKEGRKPVVRLVVPTDKVYAFDDMVRGHVEFQSSGVGDFIIMKSDGIPVYNFAVVIDDALMGVTDVIRAEEHLSNTPRQLAIYEALGYKVPRFGHISLILGSDHKKMSKRHGATSVQAYRDMGYLPDAMVNYLALLGWAPKGEQELFTREELIKEFSMDRVSSNDAVFDIEKRDWLEKVVWYVRDHLYFGQQVVENVKPFFEEPAPVEDAEIKAIIDAEDSHKILAAYAEALKALPEFNEDSIKKCFKAVMKETGIKGKAAFEPVRIALTGQTQGPGLYTMIELLGLEETEKRLNRF